MGRVLLLHQSFTVMFVIKATELLSEATQRLDQCEFGCLNTDLVREMSLSGEFKPYFCLPLCVSQRFARSNKVRVQDVETIHRDAQIAGTHSCVECPVG